MSAAGRATPGVPSPAGGQRLHWPAGSLAEAGFDVLLAPETAAWSHTGLRVGRLAAGGRLELTTGSEEMAILPLSGALDVHVEGLLLRLEGRDSVFAKVSDWAYVPVDAELRLESAGGCEVAIASAHASRRFDPARVTAGDVPVEVRGAGRATRQVTNFMAPGVFGGAERLMCVEVLTPDGNWSSYPPHKHDDSPECTANNEEIYYFRVGRIGGPDASAEGFAFHRTYTVDGSIEESVVVRDGDVFCVPRGYHGPCVAAPGYPLYYLNVLAGAGDERSLAFCDDPSHAWVRDSWTGMALDPRCPMTDASGRVSP
jgi:5-deoxy-glucuronate isomerase